MDKVKISYLTNHPDVITTLAQWFYNEWSYLNPGRTLHDVEDTLRLRIDRYVPPFTLVAFNGNELVGTVSLKPYDMAQRDDLSPWLSSLYVKESYRNRGVGTQLVTAIETKARELGIGTLYLYTSTAERLYINLGWLVKERLIYYGETAVIMEKML